MNFEKQLRSLCTPAQIYFVISTVSILAMLSQNVMNDNMYTIGYYRTLMPFNNMVTFVCKILYVLFWTYALNFLCKKGYTTFSWFLVFFPFIAMFVLIGLVILLGARNSMMMIASKI